MQPTVLDGSKIKIFHMIGITVYIFPDRISDKFIQEIIQDLEAAKAAGNENTSPSVMQTFLNTEGLSKSDVTTMVLDMLFAGVDTVRQNIFAERHAISQIIRKNTSILCFY